MRKLIWLLLLIPALLALSVFAADNEPETAIAVDDVAVTDNAKPEEEVEPTFADLAWQFRNHCVRVFIQTRPSEGQRPSTFSFSEDIRHERPTFIGGYWWDDKHVIVPDPVLQDRFVGSIEVQLPGGDKRYPARLAGRFVKLQALLLEVDAGEDGSHPEARPMEFIDGDLDDALLFAYEWDEGEWRVIAKTGLGTSAMSDDGVDTVALADEGVIIDNRGNVIGLAFGERVVFDEENPYWAGREVG